MDEDRLKHSLSVARKMVEIAKEKNMTEEEIMNCFVLGFVHDIGYEYSNNGVEHNIVGASLLKDTGFKFYNEVYYHGQLDIDYSSIYLDILNQADMQIDKYGNDVGYDKRLEDIKSRYGIESNIYKKCRKLVDKVGEKNENR